MAEFNPLKWNWDWLTGSKPPTIDPNSPQYQMADTGYMGDYIKGQLGGAQGSYKPVYGAQIDQGPQGGFRSGQSTLAQQLQGIASGQQAGAGELAVRRQIAQAMAAQQAAQQASRGSNAAIAARAAARGAADLGVNGAGMSSQAALQDQGAARGLLAGVLGQGREQDIGLAQSQAGLNQQANLSNQQAGLQQQTINNNQQLGLLAQLLGLNQGNLQGRLGATGLQQQYGGSKGYLGDLIGAGGQLGVASIMASDRRLKDDEQDGRAAVREFLTAIAPKTFKYKDQARHGDGTFAGVMAQDAERSTIGRSMVRDTEGGKMLDGRKALSALLASVADLHGRVSDIEAPARTKKKAR